MSTTLQNWLSEPPSYTTFRLNNLLQFNTDELKNYLHAQCQQLQCSNIPKLYYLNNDCLVVEKWLTNIVFVRTKNEVIVDPACASAVLKGAHVYAPGVMGLPTNCQVDEQIDIYGDLEGKCKRGLKLPYTGKKTYVGTGYLKMLRHDLFDNGVVPSGIAVHTILPESRLPVVNETIYPEGHILLQNLPSIITGWVVSAKPEEFILDMCAAPGNKTTHLAEMSGNKANIIALDKSEQKVAKIQNSCRIQKVTCVHAYAYDSTKSYCDDHNGREQIPPFPGNYFDKVLLDAPCSGLGQRPQLCNKMTPKMLQSYKFVQRKLITAAGKVLKVGGKLVYSTCTVTVEENEEMVAWALEKFSYLQLVPAEPLHGGPGLPNVGLTDEQRAMVQRFGPTDDPLRPVQDLYKNTIGFFIASFVKVKDHKSCLSHNKIF